MGKVIVQDYTYKKPITMIGVEAGICWGANTSNDEKNYLRGIDCLESGHGRTFEFPDVYLTLEGYSARVIREWYTHIGGLPTRLQASTRYIDYEHGFGYVTPPSIEGNPEAKKVYEDLMGHIKSYLESLDTIGVPREDSAIMASAHAPSKRTRIRSVCARSSERWQVEPATAVSTQRRHKERINHDDSHEQIDNYLRDHKRVR